MKRIPLFAWVIVGGMLVWGVYLTYAGIRARVTGVPAGFTFENWVPGEELFAGPCVIAFAVFGLYLYARDGDRGGDDDGRT